MASPPFSLNIGVPGNSDIASQFPTLDRSDKDVIQSWLLVQMNSQGHDLETILDRVGSANGLVSAPTPSTAGVNAVYTDTDNTLKVYSADQNTLQAGNAPEYVGVPPGTIIDYAGATAPVGYLLCFGQAISRTAYARLFTALGTVWGSGDGSTTFNVPDLRGIATFGKDNMGGSTAGRISVGGGNYDGTVLGAGQVLQEVALAQANLPSVNFTVSSVSVTVTGTITFNQASTGSITPVGSNAVVTTSPATGQIAIGDGAPNLGQRTTLSGTVSGQTAASGGSSTPFGIIPNSAIVNKCIKY